MPANLVNAESVSKAYGTTLVLDGVSLGVAAGERIGVVGRNGGGKSTLLALMSGEEQPDSGRVTRTGGTHIATVAQRGGLPEHATVREAVVGTGAEHEWAGDAAIRTVLHGLGLFGLDPDAGLDVDIARLSGGERRRVSLAAALVQQADLLVLDEPTNHLDVEGIAWLAEHLASRRQALLVVTHDRWFLDAVCTRTWEVADATVHQFDGGYAAYVLARAERARQAEASEARRQNLLRKELAWLRRGAPARTSKPRFRIEAAEALIAGEPPPRETMQLRALARRRLGRTVFELHDVEVRAGARVLLDHASWNVGPGDRIGVIGVNGSGKTHLLRLLAGALEPSGGRVRIGQTVHSGYLSQEVTELPDRLRVIEAIREAADTAVVDGTELSAAQLGERFGFANDRQWTPVADLSGGERRRLQLLRLLLARPNVLLLDEPTNDLDTDTLAALEDLLDSWPGTLVVVSHDRYLLERVCDSTVALMGDGTLAALPGGVEEYLARRSARDVVAGSPGRGGPPATDRGRSSGRGNGSPDDALGAGGAGPEGTGTRGGGTRAAGRVARRELTRLERRMDTLEKRADALHAELAEHATDYAKVAGLDAELRAVRAELDDVEQQWLERAEAAEADATH